MKSFPSQPAHKAELISESMTLSQTPAEAIRPRTRANVSHGVSVYSQLTPTPNYAAWWQRQMCVNNLPKVAIDSAAAAIEPAISNRKSNSLTITPTSRNE